MSVDDVKAHVQGAVDGVLGRGLALVLLAVITGFVGWQSLTLVQHTGQLSAVNEHLQNLDQTTGSRNEAEDRQISRLTEQIDKLRDSIERQNLTIGRLTQKVFGNSLGTGEQ